jgi:hypothetical protein
MAMVSNLPLRLAIQTSCWLIFIATAYLTVCGLSRFADHVSVVPTIISAVLAAAILMGWSFPDQQSRRLLLAALLVAGVLTISGAYLADGLWDISYDGQAYHLPGALDIQGGWNPARDVPVLGTERAYPNGIWTLQALILDLTSSLEAGKIVAGLLALSSLPVTALAFRQVRGTWDWPVWIAVVMVSICPPAILDILTHGSDGPVYSLSLLQISAAILLINAKLSGPYWAGLIALATLIQGWWLDKRFPMQILAVGLLSSVIAIGIVGWHPYITRPLQTGQLLDVGLDVLVGPANLMDAGPLTRLLFLMFGRLGNATGSEIALLRWPWQLDAADFALLAGARTGGFGHWFGIQVLGGALIALTSSIGRRWSIPREGLAPLWTIIVFAAGLFFPASWWARLVAPLWIALALVIVWPPADARLNIPGRILKGLGWIALLGGLAVNIVTTAGSFVGLIQAETGYRRLFAQMRAEDRTLVVQPLMEGLETFDLSYRIWSLRLLEIGVKSIVLDPTFPCQTELVRGGSYRICLLN